MSATVSGAIAYLGARLGGETFTEETELRQSQALNSAADTLSPYLSGMKQDAAEMAVYEQALWLLGSFADLQASGVTSHSLSGLSHTFDLKGRPAAVAPAAWRIIKNGADGRGRRTGAAWLS